MEAVVEFHGFKDNDNRFIVKELAIVSILFQTHLVFLPPYYFRRLNYKSRKTARWLSNNFHLISWDEGSIPYNEELIRMLCKPFKVIHTKGLEKAQFLKEFHPEVREITLECNIDCNIECFLPQHKYGKCALKNAKSYYTQLNF